MATTAESGAAVTETAGKSERVARYLPGESGMWFFIIGDLLTFGVYLLACMIYRGQNAELFLHSQQHLNPDIGMVNTVILLTSSCSLALGTEAARRGKAADAFRLLGLTVAYSPVSNWSNGSPKSPPDTAPARTSFSCITT